ncbi:MAG: hypothetical protein ACLUPL_04280 [Butyricimonas virosa]
MPPPPFWITMIRSDREQFLIHKALESYRKLLSPTISVVIPSMLRRHPAVRYNHQCTCPSCNRYGPLCTGKVGRNVYGHCCLVETALGRKWDEHGKAFRSHHGLFQVVIVYLRCFSSR